MTRLRHPLAVLAAWAGVCAPLLAQSRDPFTPLVVATTPAASKASPVRRPAGLAGLAAADVSLKGVITSGTTRLALLEGPDGKTHLARLRDRLHDAVVTRIETDAVVLMEQGKSQETRKPLRPNAGGGMQ